MVTDCPALQKYSKKKKQKRIVGNKKWMFFMLSYTSVAPSSGAIPYNYDFTLCATFWVVYDPAVSVLWPIV